MKGEWSHYSRRPELHDLEVLHARFIEHSFARHSHDYYVVGYVEAGVQAYRDRHGRHVTAKGEVFLVNPGEIHTGEPGAPEGYIYRTMYPRIALLQQVTREICGRDRLPFFKHAVLHDDALAARLTRLHRAIAEQSSRSAVEWHLFASLACLITRYADERAPLRSVPSERVTTKRAREYIDAYFATDVSLTQLAALVDRSPFHFARVFGREVGVPPHVYLDCVRIRRARELLERSVPPAEVAAAVGYADQSHLTHRFKRLLGITPGQYRAASRLRRRGPAASGPCRPNGRA